MNKYIILLLMLSTSTYTQSVVDFESFDTGISGFLNGSDANGEFCEEDICLPNDYNANYDSWQGWAISSTTDTTTPGFTNEFSSYAGSGFNESTNYAVSFSFGPNIIHVGNSQPQVVSGFYICNNTYAYLSIRDGDAFSKKFGGISGDDPDYFLLTVKKFLGGDLSQDSINFYLADYRFENNNEDYIIDDWTWLDLSDLGAADSLYLSLSSTDNGQFGMNTPAYFCIDNLTTLLTVNDEETQLSTISIFPNPAKDVLYIDGQVDGSFEYKIFDLSGKLITNSGVSRTKSVDITQLTSGAYFIHFTNNGTHGHQLFVKQ